VAGVVNGTSGASGSPPRARCRPRRSACALSHSGHPNQVRTCSRWPTSPRIAASASPAEAAPARTPQERVHLPTGQVQLGSHRVNRAQTDLVELRETADHLSTRHRQLPHLSGGGHHTALGHSLYASSSTVEPHRRAQEYGQRSTVVHTTSVRPDVCTRPHSRRKSGIPPCSRLRKTTVVLGYPKRTVSSVQTLTRRQDRLMSRAITHASFPKAAMPAPRSRFRQDSRSSITFLISVTDAAGRDVR
jgi:hypothetical protein